MARVMTVMTTTFLFLSTTLLAQSAEWHPVTGEGNLRNFMSGKTLEWEEPSGDKSRGEYRPDGTGILYSWGGAEIPRTWEIKGENQVCITARQDVACWQLEKNNADPNLYRSLDASTGKMTDIRMSTDGTKATIQSDSKSAGNKGGAAAASADEMAAQLSNPNSPVATLTFKNMFTTYEGSLPDADNQWDYTLLFQPTLPFILDSGAKVFFRPAVPIHLGKPSFDSAADSFDDNSGIGDIVFDLVYAPKIESKDTLLSFGFVTSLPTATESTLGSGQWTLGPEVFIGKLLPKGLIALFPNHTWDVSGWGESAISVTSVQPLATYLPGGGWAIGTAPVITYDWNSEQWVVPMNLTVDKTVVIGGRPWKLGVELNYYVEKSDTFGPDVGISFNITPVVKNGLASWFGLGDN